MQGLHWEGHWFTLESAGDLQVSVHQLAKTKTKSAILRLIYYLCEYSFEILIKTLAGVCSAGALAYQVWVKHQHLSPLRGRVLCRPPPVQDKGDSESLLRQKSGNHIQRWKCRWTRDQGHVQELHDNQPVAGVNLERGCLEDQSVEPYGGGRKPHSGTWRGVGVVQQTYLQIKKKNPILVFASVQIRHRPAHQPPLVD